MNNLTPIGQFCIRITLFMLSFWAITSYMVLDINPLHWGGPHRFVACCYAISVIIYSYAESFKQNNKDYD